MNYAQEFLDSKRSFSKVAFTKTAGPAVNELVRGAGALMSKHPMLSVLGLAGAGALGSITDNVFQRPLETFSERINTALHPNLNARLGGDNISGEEYYKALGKQRAEAAYAAEQAASFQDRLKAHSAVLEQVVANDPVLDRATPEALSSAFSTMVRFAPTLAQDPNVVRSFLRETVVNGSAGGIEPNAIKLLGQTEQSVRGF